MKRMLKILGLITLVLVLGGGVYGFSVYRNVANMMNGVHEEIESNDVRESAVNVKRSEPFSVLLMGIDRDEGRGSGGRSDTMMVVTINPDEKSTKILSVARDTYAEIAGRGVMDKINHAYAFGGVEMAINTVQNFLNIPIDYYAEIDMDGLMALINLVGTINVENDFAFSYDGIHFPEGMVELDGNSALSFSRMRYEDPNGDFGRQGRQRDILIALTKELAGMATTSYKDILDTVGDYLKTNMTLDEIISISLNYHSALNQIDQLDLRGSGQKIGGVYYQMIPSEEVQAVSTELRNHLELY